MFSVKTQSRLTKAVSGVYSIIAALATPHDQPPDGTVHVIQYDQWWKESGSLIVLVDQGEPVEPPNLLRVILDFLECVTVKRQKKQAEPHISHKLKNISTSTDVVLFINSTIMLKPVSKLHSL